MSSIFTREVGKKKKKEKFRRAHYRPVHIPPWAVLKTKTHTEIKGQETQVTYIPFA